MGRTAAGWPSGSGAAVAAQVGRTLPRLGLQAMSHKASCSRERETCHSRESKRSRSLPPLPLARRCSMGWRRASGNWAGQALRGSSASGAGLHHIGQGDQPLTTGIQAKEQRGPGLAVGRWLSAVETT